MGKHCLPDTFNLDWPKGRWISVVHFPRIKTAGAGAAGDHRYVLTDFDDLPEPPAEAARDRLLRGATLDAVALGGEPPCDLEPILEGCPWLDHWVKNGRQLQGDAYEAVVGVLSRCFLRGLDGRGLVHRLSEEHPGHNPVATEEKLALAATREPPTCRRIDRLGDDQSHCRRCPHFGHLEAPLDLGRPVAGVVVERGGVDVDRVSAAESPGDSAAGAGAGDQGPIPIVVSPREHEVNDRVLAALAAREPNLFARGGVLVEVVRPEASPAAGQTRAPGMPLGREPLGALARTSSSPRVKPIAEARMREMLARHCAFQAPASFLTGDPRPLHPPRWVVRALLSRRSWPELPALAGVIECPVLSAGGTVLQRPGYDRASALLYAPSAQFQVVPEAPDRAEALAALDELREVVEDFPFATEAHRAAWLCALLTPLARAAFSGPSPLHLIEANVRGCGKTLLADVCSVLLTGRPAARMSLPGRETELRKAITSLALEAERTVLLDNVSGVLGSPTLDRALTAEIWRDRLLGGNRQVALPLAVTWYATGNNVAVAGDTARRCLHIRLQSACDRPERRADFKHPRLLAWLSRERPRLLPAAVTLLRAYVVAGRPRQELAAWGSFEGWSDLVRSTVTWLGLPDPARVRDVADPVNAGQAVPHDLIFGFADVLEDLGGAATVRQILDRLTGAPAAYARLRSALAELFPSRRGQLPTSLQLAGRLRVYRGRLVRGACIARARKRDGVVRWTVRRAAAA